MNFRLKEKSCRHDRLDAVGTVGVARVMCYSGVQERDKSQSGYEAAWKYDTWRISRRSTAIMHFYEKLLKLKDLMNTKW